MKVECFHASKFSQAVKLKRLVQEHRSSNLLTHAQMNTAEVRTCASCPKMKGQYDFTPQDHHPI